MLQKALLLILVVILPASSFAYAEDSSKTDFSWWHVGLGGIVIENKQGPAALGLAAMINYSYRSTDRAYSVRVLEGAEVFFVDDQKVTEFAFLLNKAWEDKSRLFPNFKTSFLVGAGASLLYGLKKGSYLGLDRNGFSDYERIPFVTVGLPIQIQGSLTPSNFGFGIDILGFANLNFVQSFWGVCLCPRFGRAN